MSKKWKLKYHDIAQNTPEWLDLRSGKITGSVAEKLNPKGLGKGLKTYIYKKAIERLYGRQDGSWSNIATEHGHENEPIAIQRFEFESGLIARDSGFYSVSEGVGCSLDFEVDSDSSIGEVKSFFKKAHLALVEYIDKHQALPKKQNSQVQFNLMVTDKKGCWFVADYPQDGINDEHVEKDMQFRKIFIPRDENLILYYQSKVEMVEDLIDIKAEEIKSNENKVQCVGVMFGSSDTVYHYGVGRYTLDCTVGSTVTVDTKNGEAMAEVVEVVDKPEILITSTITGVL